MWCVLKLALLLAWCWTLGCLIFVSVVTFILFNICLTIFLFWLTITLIGWSLALIPILTFVFLPWHHRRCRRWTIQERQSRLSVAFFHPYADNEDDRERVLWFAVDSLLKKHHKDVQIIIYTGEKQVKPQEVLRRVNGQFDIDVERWSSSITFIPLRSRCLLDVKYYKLGTLWGQSIASIIVGLEALFRFVPDVHVDLSGYALTYPCVYYLAAIPIISYVHDPPITSNLVEPTDEQYPLDNSFLSQLELFSQQLFTCTYRWSGRCSTLVLCSSLGTKKQIKYLWEPHSLHLLYPPCGAQQLLDMPFIDRDKTIVSVGPFRSDQYREFQIRAFHELLQRKTEYKQGLKLVLIGNVRHDEEKNHLEQLRLLVKDLDIDDKVEFKINIGFNEVRAQLKQAMIGVQTAWNQSLDIGMVDMMAAGVIVVVHQSSGAKVDIIDDEQTGFLASDFDSYATTMHRILEMTADERCEVQKRARDSVSRFDRSHFERSFTELFDPILTISLPVK